MGCLKHWGCKNMILVKQIWQMIQFVFVFALRKASKVYIYNVFYRVEQKFARQQSHDLFSRCSSSSIGWESECGKTVGESDWLSWWTVPPYCAMSSRAISSNASSMLWCCLAEVSSAASAPVRSASVHASSNSTCRCASRSHLLPAGHKRYHEYRACLLLKASGIYPE